jgi:hypothetical protein
MDVSPRGATLVGYGKTTVTTTAAAIGSLVDLMETHLRADPDNTVTIYLGDANVTSSNGYALPAGEVALEPVRDLGTIYAVVASGTATLYYKSYRK